MMMSDEMPFAFLNRDVEVLLLFLVIYIIALFAMRFLKVLKKRICPTCSGKITRRRKNFLDKILVALTFYILPLRRYKCIHCGWEGLRWNARKHKSKRSADDDD